MNFKGIYYSLTFRLALAIGLTAALTYLALVEEWGWFLFLGIGWMAALRGISLLFKRNAQKVAFMFDAIDNSDYAFKYATRGRSSNDKLVSESLNRITQILFQAKAEAIQKEKYYELIMNQVNTGIIVEDDKGNIFQTNNEALRLLGLTVFTHARQLGRIDENLERLISDVRPGDVDKFQAVLRVPQPVHQLAHPLQTEAASLPVGGVDKSERFVKLHVFSLPLRAARGARAHR